MLRFPCLVLDHDDTVVQSESTVNFPYFVHILDQFRPGATITQEEYVRGCCNLGFAQMCRQWYGFSEAELLEEYLGWKQYVMTHVPAPYPGIGRIIRRQKEEGGLLCVVSHSCNDNITRDYLEHFGITPDEIYGYDLPEVQRKPSPWPLHQIMKKYDLRPDQMLVVDDLKPAWEMARSAGVPIAFAAWGRRDYLEIMKTMENLCDHTFYSTEELEKFLFG